MRKIIRRITIFLIVSALSFNTNIFAFASTDLELGESTLTLTPLTQSSVLLSDGESRAFVTITQLQNGFMVHLDSEDENGFFIVNQEQYTIYSSFTGQTISYTTLANVGGASTNAVVDTMTYNVSYSQIAGLIGGAWTAYGLASAIATIVAAAGAPITIAFLTTMIYGELKGQLVSNIISCVQNGVSGGVRLKINVIEIYKHQGGRIVKGYRYQLAGISQY